LSIILRGIGLNRHKIYKDLRFKGEFNVRVNDKRMKLYHHGGKIENEVFWHGLFKTWEADTGYFWLKLCKLSDVVLDIGANTGIYSMVTKTLHPTSEIYAFEPSRNTFDKLLQNKELNHFDMHCFSLALSDHFGESVFYDSFDPNQTSASLAADMHKLWGENHVSNEYVVKTSTLDEFIKDHSIQKIDLIKIDVEMHEPEIIEGFKHSIKHLNPIIFIEVLSEKVASKLTVLIPENYRKFHIGLNNELTEKTQFEVVPLQWNYLLIPKEREEALELIASYIKIR
jgi:FkbM family methyltransferase